jgi:acyl-CoA thioester hydrolase
MQEAAFDASATAGFPSGMYAQLGYHWLIRSSEIEYLQPVHSGETILVKTWVHDFQGVTSRRMYEFLRGDENELVARASTEWVLLDDNTGKPRRIPNELANAFFPEGLPENFPARRRFPVAPAPPVGAYRAVVEVTWRDIDPVGHVNNAVYLDYVEICGFKAVAAFNWPVQRMLEARFAILIRQNQIEYLQPARLGDRLEITTWVSGVKGATATRHYTIHRVKGSELICRVHSLGVWVNLDTGRPVRIPQPMLADFAANITPEM